MRRRIRTARPSRRELVIAEYLAKKQEYEAQAKAAQTQSWKSFCERQNKETVWQRIHRVINKTTKREEDLPLYDQGRQLNNKESAEKLAEVFYPPDTEEGETEEHKRIRTIANTHIPIHNTDEPDITEDELWDSVMSFDHKKAPGKDGFTADICQQTIQKDIQLYLAIFNKCWKMSFFPTKWKEAIIIVLKKPNKTDYTNPKAYRPIGLLPVMGKMFEKIVMRRITWHLIPRQSPRQYGFTPQKGTEDSLYDLMAHVRGELNKRKLITLVSLDIEGAFDNAWWPAIKARLVEEQCPGSLRKLISSYLDGRSIQIRYAGNEHNRTTNKGCVQGSVGGPTLWNLILDPLLWDLIGAGVYCQAFADDVVLVLSGDKAAEIERHGNATLERVRRWGVANKLNFAPNKTRAMTITRKLKYDTPRLSMGGMDIAMSSEIKILGLTIDNKLTFNNHVVNICSKAMGIYKNLSRAARVSWGLHPEVIKIIYNAAVEPIITYAASAWASETKKRYIQKQLNTTQRSFAQKISRSYKTVSLNAALVLAGILPLDIRIRENASLYESKRGVSRLAEDIEIEKPTLFKDKPHPAKRIKRHYGKIETPDELDERVDGAVSIYTDGSRIEDKVGASMTIWDNEEEIKFQKFKLSSYCTVFQAEIYAIYRATEEAVKSKNSKYAILSDSKSSLDNIINQNSTHPLATLIRKNLDNCQSQNKTVNLFWIKSHTNIAGNERADNLAKEAALLLKSKPHYDRCPVSFAKQQIRKEALGEWNRRYQNGDTAKVTKFIFPDAIKAHRIITKLTTSKELTQILTGHGGFSEYLHRFRCKESPVCPCDGTTPETTSHILFQCPIYIHKRYDLELKLDQKIELDKASQLLDKEETRKEFINYCIEIAKIVINRNKS